jgi:hypothetical protein
MLLDYMLNPANSVQDRWNTFALYVQQSSASSDEQTMAVTGILTLANPTADAALKAWRWAPADQAAVVKAMTAKATEAYQTLGGYLYKGKALPVKVAATVAQQYITHGK